MAFWGVEVKPGEPYVHSAESSHGRLRISQATLGNYEDFGWSMLEGSAGDDKRLVRLCALNPTSAPMCHLELELDEDEEVVFSVLGQSSIHLSGYYILSHNGDHGRNSEKPTGKAARRTCLKENHQEIPENGECKTPRTEEALYDQIMLQQDANNNNKDERTPHNSDHGCNIERDTHAKCIDDSNKNNDTMSHSPSRNKKEVLEKPTGIAATGTCLKKKHQLNDTDGKNDSSLKKSISKGLMFESTREDGEDEDDLPINVAFLKRRAARADATTMRSEKRKCKTLRIEEMLSDQNLLQCDVDSNTQYERPSHPEGSHNVKDQVNGQCDSKIMESNAMDTEPAQGHRINQEGDVLQTAIQEQGASQTEGHNDVADKIIRIPDDGYYFTGAAENDVVKQNEEAEHSENVQTEVPPNHSQTLDNDMKIEDLIVGNTGAKVASNGSKVSVKYVGRLMNGKIVDPIDDNNIHKFKLGAGKVICGWDIGISGMRVGGKRRLTIPPHLGYGAEAEGLIPANSWLIYEVELLKVKRGRRAPQASASAC